MAVLVEKRADWCADDRTETLGGHDGAEVASLTFGVDLADGGHPCREGEDKAEADGDGGNGEDC